MFNSLILINTEPNYDNSVGGITQTAIKKAKLKNSQWFVIIVSGLLLTFILSYSLIPAFKATIPLTDGDVRMAFWLVVIMAIGFCVLFALPDIIRDFKNK